MKNCPIKQESNEVNLFKNVSIFHNRGIFVTGSKLHQHRFVNNLIHHGYQVLVLCSSFIIRGCFKMKLKAIWKISLQFEYKVLVFALIDASAAVVSSLIVLQVRAVLVQIARNENNTVTPKNITWGWKAKLSKITK